MPRAMKYLGCKMLPRTCLCTGGFCCLKHTQNVFSCVQKPDFAWKCLLFNQQERVTDSKLGTSGPDGDLPKSTKQEYGGFLIGKIYSTQWTKPSPIEGFLIKATLAFFLPWLILNLGQMRHFSAHGSLWLVCYREFTSLEKQYKCVLFFGETWFGMKMPSFHKWQKSAHREQRKSGYNGNI